MIAFAPSPVIETPRLRLRAARRNDAAAIARLANDPGVVRMTGSMPFPYTLADAEAFLARASENDPARATMFAIERPEDGLIGTVGLSPNAEGRAELGYWLGRPFWGQGYATEAARGALSFAARDWGRRLVVAGHHADNDASGWVLTKAGFLYTGVVQRTYSRARGGDVPTRMMVWLA